MDIFYTLVYLLLLTGFSTNAKEKNMNLRLQNTTDVLDEDSLLPIKERYRRLIPYMTFYLSQQAYSNPPQYQTTTQQYNPVPVAVAKKVQPQYIQPQYQQNTAQYQGYPSTFLIGNPQQGYRRVPLYSNIVQPNYVPYSYTPQQPSDLSRLIAQNYLAIAKKVQTMPQIQTQTQAPQYTYKQYPTPQYTATSYKTVSQFPKETYQPRYQISQSPVSSPKYNYNYVPQYSPTERPQQTGSEYVLTQSHELEVEDEKPTAAPLQDVYKEPTDNLASDILAGYQLTKTLPERLTSSNIGSSIRTLSHVLKLLQRVKLIPQPVEHEEQEDIEEEEEEDKEDYNNNKLSQNYPASQTEGSTPGKAGVDYPALSEIPETSFNCKDQRYKGFFGDPETNCQVWHYCDLNGGQASFLCPNGTIFSQVALTCDWWFNVKCASTAQLYVLNERLYKYILPYKPSFPEDYAGPLVDEYLTLKFKELEAKKSKNATITKDPESTNTLREILTDEIRDVRKA